MRKPGVIILALFFLCLPALFLHVLSPLLFGISLFQGFFLPPPPPCLLFFSLTFIRYLCHLCFTHFILSLLDCSFLCLTRPTKHTSKELDPGGQVGSDSVSSSNTCCYWQGFELRRECLFLGHGEGATRSKDSGVEKSSLVWRGWRGITSGQRGGEIKLPVAAVHQAGSW